MKQFALIAFFFLVIFDEGISQIRLTTLIVKPKEVYEIQGADILVIDTLILRDSASIRLNSSRKENFIHVKKLVVGKGCIINGKGKNGVPGTMGGPGLTAIGPCRDGTSGEPGTPGASGEDAVSLFLYFDAIEIHGNIQIDLAGGDGGQGGKGGTGSDGNPGTKLCQGGGGGNGGNGGAGGNGGQSGSLTITSKFGSDLRSWMGERIIVRSFGGFAGVGGDGGLGGQRGLSTLRDGDQGRKGLTGAGGVPGKPGAIFFERK